MSRFIFAPAMVVAAAVLSACGITPNPGIGPNGELPVIARAHDHGTDSISLAQEKTPGIAYDPDGCQAWILDDGVEGYIGRRRDATSGMPICNSLYPPGSVVGQYQTEGAGLGDWVPRPAYGPLNGQRTN